MDVTNNSTRDGTEVVQLYVSYPTTSELTHPPLMLKAFTKVSCLAPGASEVAKLAFDKYGVSYWEERVQRWVVEKGVYRVRVGPSSAPRDLGMSAEFVIRNRLEWVGI